MSKLKQMQTFMLIAESGSIVRASNKLHITKAAASKQLIELEKQLKVQLITRSTRSLKLTDAGKLFYESCKKVLVAVDEAETCIQRLHKKPSGILRITSHRYFAEKYIIPHLKEFSLLCPDLNIDLELAERFPDLEKENIDILFGIGYTGPDHLVRKKIAAARHVLCASPRYLKEFGTPTTPEDLQNHRYITHTLRNPDNTLTFNNKEIIVQPYLRLNDAQAMLQCALNDLGIVKLHNYLVSDAIKKGQLKVVLPKHQEDEKTIYVFYKHQNMVQPKVRWFLDFIYKKLE